MKKFVTVEKMSKKDQKAYHAKNRTLVGFSTGTQVHKDKRRQSRQKMKEDLRREVF